VTLEGVPGEEVARQVRAALAEDVGAGDVTAALVPATQRVVGRVIAREAAVICGKAWVEEVFRQLDPSAELAWQVNDGEVVSPDGSVFVVRGRARPILTGERTALNFLQTLSGTATAARRYVDAVRGTDCQILDTRKTLPGLRLAQKYATRCGGASNHRIGLYDMVLIKENHIVAAGSIGAAIKTARQQSPNLRVEVEVESLVELEAALDAGADIVMLDELSLEDMVAAVSLNRERGATAKLEASGGITLEGVRQVAETGVDYISIGGITKHVQAVDLSMRLQFESTH
jgi:nicotinate-nucleotide pyrophosphorylase (carboxylating)